MFSLLDVLLIQGDGILRSCLQFVYRQTTALYDVTLVGRAFSDWFIALLFLNSAIFMFVSIRTHGLCILTASFVFLKLFGCL